MTAFVLLGDVMMDVTASVTEAINHGSDTAATVTWQPGGSAANTARWLAWAGQSTSLIGCIGGDPQGAMVREALVRDGVAPLMRTAAESRTGTCIVIVEPTGERTMLPDAGANALLTPADLPEGAFASDGHLHLSGYTLLREATRAVGMAALRLARESGMSTSLDASSAAPIRARPDAFDDALGLVDLLVANADEAVALTGARDPQEAGTVLATRARALVVVKLGPQGALGFDGGEQQRAASVASVIVDTTGAGDAFAAGLLASWTTGSPLQQALQRGNELAAVAVGRVGAGPPTTQGQECSTGGPFPSNWPAQPPAPIERD